MLRRMMTALVFALVGIVAFGGIAAADPGDYGVEDGINVDIADEDRTVAVGDTSDFFGDGFAPGEAVDVSIIYSATGLRRTTTVVADANGSIYIPGVAFVLSGNASIEALGQESGKAGAFSVNVLNATGTSNGSTQGGVQVNGGGSGGVGSQGSSDPDQNWSSDNDGSGLAYTGAGSTGGGLAYTGSSVAGPIAIGAAALLAGLALLFFGTRGAVRRKSAQGPR